MVSLHINGYMVVTSLPKVKIYRLVWIPQRLLVDCWRPEKEFGMRLRRNGLVIVSPSSPIRWRDHLWNATQGSLSCCGDNELSQERSREFGLDLYVWWSSRGPQYGLLLAPRWCGRRWIRSVLLPDERSWMQRWKARQSTRCRSQWIPCWRHSRDATILGCFRRCSVGGTATTRSISDRGFGPEWWSKSRHLVGSWRSRTTNFGPYSSSTSTGTFLPYEDDFESGVVGRADR